MVYKLDKKEIKIIIIFGIILFFWFNFFVNKFYAMANSSPMLYYFIFILLYSGFITYYIHGITPTQNPRLVIALFLALLLGDLLLFPLIIPRDHPPILTQETMYSSDVFIYSFIKDLKLSDIIKYNIVYVVSGVFLLMLIALLLSGKRFSQALREIF